MKISFVRKPGELFIKQDWKCFSKINCMTVVSFSLCLVHFKVQPTHLLPLQSKIWCTRSLANDLQRLSSLQPIPHSGPLKLAWHWSTKKIIWAAFLNIFTDVSLCIRFSKVIKYQAWHILQDGGEFNNEVIWTRYFNRFTQIYFCSTRLFFFRHFTLNLRHLSVLLPWNFNYTIIYRIYQERQLIFSLFIKNC